MIDIFKRSPNTHTVPASVPFATTSERRSNSLSMTTHDERVPVGVPDRPIRIAEDIPCDHGARFPVVRLAPSSAQHLVVEQVGVVKEAEHPDAFRDVFVMWGEHES